jgi:NAD(P)-dependent dehydrogenase (short-subunit alcohol dehydrogenase family)
MASLASASRVEIVTGSSRRIGLGIAERLADDGARVVVYNWSAEEAVDVVAGIEEKGGKPFESRPTVRSSPTSLDHFRMRSSRHRGEQRRTAGRRSRLLSSESLSGA